ncbi:MAG: O-antigen ligase family protein [Thiohalomonadaceae bacterium]
MGEMTHGKQVRLASGIALAVIPALLVFNTNLAINLLYVLSVLGIYGLATHRTDMDVATRWVLAAVLVFLVSALITYAASGADTVGLHYFESIHIKVLLIVPLILLMRWVRPSPHWFWWGALIGSCIAGVMALYEVHATFGFDLEQLLADSHFRVRVGHHPVIFGMFVASLTLLATAGARYFLAQTKWIKAVWIGGVALGLLATLLTSTRGAWLGLLVALAVTLWLQVRRLSWKHRWALVVALVLAVPALYSIPRVEKRVVTAISEARNYFEPAAGPQAVKTSIGARFEMWRTAMFIADEYPWFGAGLGRAAWQNNAQRLVAAQRVDPVAAEYKHAHSQYFHTLATRGVIGLLTELSLMLLCAAVFIRYMRQHGSDQRQLALAGLLLTLAYLVYGLSDVPLEHQNVLMLYVYAAGVLLGLAGARPAETASELARGQPVTRQPGYIPGH